MQQTHTIHAYLHVRLCVNRDLMDKNAKTNTKPTVHPDHETDCSTMYKNHRCRTIKGCGTRAASQQGGPSPMRIQDTAHKSTKRSIITLRSRARTFTKGIRPSSMVRSSRGKGTRSQTSHKVRILGNARATQHKDENQENETK